VKELSGELQRYLVNCYVSDLVRRSQDAVEQIGGLAADTGVQFDTADIVALVEDGIAAMPKPCAAIWTPDYPECAGGNEARREAITMVVEAVISGELHAKGIN